MSIYRPLTQYLTGSDAITHPNDAKFRNNYQIGRIKVDDRRSAIEALYSVIGRSIHHVRRRQKLANKTPAGMTWIVVNDEDVEHAYALDGARDCIEEYARIHVYGSGEESRDRVQNAADALKLAVDGFSNGKWGDREVNWCGIEPGGTAIGLSPIDGSDNWTLRTDINLRIFHFGPTTNSWQG